MTSWSEVRDRAADAERREARQIVDTPDATLFDQRLEANYPEDRFDGRTYEPEFDAERLGKQAKAVFRAMENGAWWTLHGLAAHTGYPEASVSARLRDLRKKKFGGFNVERRRSALGSGLFFYRLVKPE